MFESPVGYFDSFIAIETYICMTSMCDAGHHHGSQYKQITAYKWQDPSQAWAFLGTFWKLLGTLWYLKHFGIIFRETLLFWTLG